MNFHIIMRFLDGHKTYVKCRPILQRIENYIFYKDEESDLEIFSQVL